MSREIDRAEVQRLQTQGVQIVDVLGESSHEFARLPGSIHLPLDRIVFDHKEKLDLARPLVVYGFAATSDDAARAAALLESLGAAEVQEYSGGLADWMAAGLPTVGTVERILTPAWLAQKAPTCGLDDLPQGPFPCYVVNAEGVLLGRVNEDFARTYPGHPARSLMTPTGPTQRVDAPLGKLLQSMKDTGSESEIVTTSRGVLVGLVSRRDVEIAEALWNEEYDRIEREKIRMRLAEFLGRPWTPEDFDQEECRRILAEEFGE